MACYNVCMQAAIDRERLGDEIAELAAHLDAATQRLLTLIRQFDEVGGWADQGALSCAHWLSWRIGLELGAAREHVRVALALADLPLVDDALRRGQVSYSKVRALTRVATPDTEATLLEMARSSTASQLERICRSYRRAVRNAAVERPEDEADRRWVRERETEAGLVRFEVQLRPDEAAMLRRALEAAMQRTTDFGGASAETSPPASLRRADALVAVAEQYLAGGATSLAPPIEVVVHVDGATLESQPQPARAMTGLRSGPRRPTGCFATPRWSRSPKIPAETCSTSGAAGAPFQRCFTCIDPERSACLCRRGGVRSRADRL